MFLIMALVSEDDVYGLPSVWRSSGDLPYSSRKYTSVFSLFTWKKLSVLLVFNFCQHLNSIDYCCNGFIHSFNEQ